MSVNAVRRSAPHAADNENNTPNTPLACSVCGKKFTSEKRYFGHLRIHSGEVLWSCDKCPRTDRYFDSQSKLKTHEGSWHAPFRPHKCSKCEDVFDRASQLDYHRRSVHLGEKSQICQICGKGFFRKNDLRTHLNVHLGTEQSICEICGRKFNHVSNLIRHCRTHAGAKPYPCAICGKRFTQISSLARHRRIHERKTSASLDVGENDRESAVRANDRVVDRSIVEIKRVARRRHYCRICGESFRFMVHLRQHGRLHARTVGSRSDKLHSCTGKERQFGCTGIAEAERTEISSNASSTSDWRDVNTERESNSDVAEPEPDSIRDHLMELDRKIQKIQKNAIEIESQHDVSISISDILSPYDCDDIELTNANNLEPKLYEGSSSGSNRQSALEKEYDIVQCLRGVDFTANIDPHLLEGTNDRSAAKNNARPKVQSREIKTSTLIARDQYINKCLHVEGSQLYIEICESEYPKSSSLHSVELHEIENVALFREVLDVADDEEASETSGTNEQEKSLEKSLSSDDEDADVRIDTVPVKEPTLRLVQTETGEQFYELILNNQCCEDFEGVDAATEVVDGEALQDGSFSGPSLTVYADDCPTVEATERSEDVEQGPREDERNFNEFLQLQPKTENSPSHSDTEMPMVRLVQNEDGEQFFELIREPLEYERTRSAGDNPRDERLSASSSDNDGSNIAGKPKPEAAIAVFKRDKKESSTDNLQRPAKDRTRKFQCTECDKSFSTAYNFKQHAGTHFSDQQQFQCKECGLSFAWKSTLNKHLAVNHRPDGPQKFVCEICPKVYSTLSQVNEHVKRDHLKERNHVCPNCGKSFFKKFDLKTHSRTHTNERPYVCRACGKRFHHQSHIIRHERIHSGERPYACDICQRTFAQPASLKAHRQRHRNVKIDILDYRMDEDDPLSLAVQ